MFKSQRKTKSCFEQKRGRENEVNYVYVFHMSLCGRILKCYEEKKKRYYCSDDRSILKS